MCSFIWTSLCLWYCHYIQNERHSIHWSLDPITNTRHSTGHDKIIHMTTPYSCQGGTCLDSSQVYRFSNTGVKGNSHMDPMLGHRLRRWPNIEPTMGQRLVFTGLITNLLRSSNVGLMLGHRLRRWSNFEPTCGWVSHDFLVPCRDYCFVGSIPVGFFGIWKVRFKSHLVYL